MMCDQSQEMLAGDSGPDGEEPVIPSATGEGGREDRISSGQQVRGAQFRNVRVHKYGASGGEVGQEDEEMTSGSHDLSSPDNHSTGSATGSTSASTKSSVNAYGSKGHVHKEMMCTVGEMKKRLPSDKRSRSKASTVEALHYALKCVKQVQANSEYYKLLMRNGQDEKSNATACTREELERVTSEHTLKNTDSFVVVVSLSSGRVLHASEQAPSILCCKRKFLESAKFVELLFHQDVNVFYSHTAQPHLPPWTNSHTAGVLFDSAQVKSFFCRIRGGKDREGEMRYNPFRVTPYQLKVQGTGSSGEEEELCCLALAERIISGYEAPRIPMDKRIFTTTHSPGCVFLEVDDRAVPLLGYLPQDLIGTSLLTSIHPDDRALLLSMHRKVLKYAGQPPFEHSPVRLRCQNGDYITLDTSWSSFINPWSRKVAFIIGRHKVRTSPLNEDVFAAPSKVDLTVTHEEIKALQAKIYKLFLQPVHNNGSSGYGSLGSNGSHEHYISVASSSDSNGNLWEDSHREPMSLQQICADVNRVRNWRQQSHFDYSHKIALLRKPTPAHLIPIASNREVRDPEESRKQTHIPSYQQINCVDNIIRYLESCTGPALKRKSEIHSLATSSSSSSTSEDDKPARANDTAQTASDVAMLESEVSIGPCTAAVVGAPLTDITMSTKAMSVVSVTSQCSYSSTIVHVPQPESEATALEDVPMGSEPTDPAPAPLRPAPCPATEERRFVGLTKEVLSAHTQKEEQEYVDRFRNRILQSPYSFYLQLDNSSMAHSQHRGEYPHTMHIGGLNRSRKVKPRLRRPKPLVSSDSYTSPPGPPRRVLDSSWPSSESSQPQMAVPYSQASPLQAPFFPMLTSQPAPEQPPRLQQLPGATPVVVQPPDQTQLNYNFHLMPQNQNLPGIQHIQMEPFQNLQNIPNFNNMQPMAPAQSINPFMTPVMAVILPNYPSFTSGYPSIYSPSPNSMLPQTPITMEGFTPAAPFPQPQFQAQPVPQTQTSPGPSLGSPRACSSAEEETADPRALFSSSRSSSPLQLNLLQEELPKPNELQSSTRHNIAESLHEQADNEGDAPSDSGNHDAQSTSSELLDLLLHEDARSGTGSNVSGSGSGESGGSLGSGSGSNGTSTSLTGSSNSSKYFASNDSSDTSRKTRKNQEAPAEHQHNFDNHVESSLWSMIQHTSEPVMMTYQIHTRDQTEVLAEDREKLRALQPLQPWFTHDQREELALVHPWIQQHTIPQEIDTQGCVTCSASAGVAHSPQPPDSSSPMEVLEPDSIVDT
ncbi:period circadian protein homolog 3 isoform X1 [Phycodurus eques]|uniref:period circadian protein homolog 3 isoform X1 n=1 Tax=Phycodurus eques TaxID=693459 RepID=UPI002ACE77E0|nr:period circadian protein homolog 3 isoform X1 [Phycodurus eques]XP_061543685.1 period circadian protein homolog 3 isoform X1 [Phycodurus eques]